MTLEDQQEDNDIYKSLLRRLDEPTVDFYHPVDKKDEFVQVHKYLKSHKRDPFDSGSMYDYADYSDLYAPEKLAPNQDPYGTYFVK